MPRLTFATYRLRKLRSILSLYISVGPSPYLATSRDVVLESASSAAASQVLRIIARLRQAACLKHGWITLLLYATRQLRVQLKASALAPSLDGCFRIGAAGPGILPRLPGDALPAILGRNQAAIKPRIEPQQGASTRRTLIVPYLADTPRGVCFHTKGAGAAPARVPRRLRLGPGLCSAPRSRRRPQPALETGPARPLGGAARDLGRRPAHETAPGPRRGRLVDKGPP